MELQILFSPLSLTRDLQVKGPSRGVTVICIKSDLEFVAIVICKGQARPNTQPVRRLLLSFTRCFTKVGITVEGALHLAYVGAQAPKVSYRKAHELL